jgi:hypothetical protein
MAPANHAPNMHTVTPTSQGHSENCMSNSKTQWDSAQAARFAPKEAKIPAKAPTANSSDRIAPES